MRALRIVLWAVGGLLALVIVVGGTVALGVNTPVGHHLLERAARLGGVEITGLQGRFPDALTAQSIAASDAQGTWLEIDGLRLDWSPTALWHKEIRSSQVTATRIRYIRPPASAPGPAAPVKPAASPFDYRVAVDHVKVDAILVPGLTFDLEGRASWQLGQDAAAADVMLSASTQDAAGQGPAALRGTLAGPLRDIRLNLVVNGRGLETTAQGSVDVSTLSADLRLGIDRPAFAGVSAQRFDATLKGNAEAAAVHAIVVGLSLPGAEPALLGDGPLTLDATYRKAAAPEIAATLSAGAVSPTGLHIAADADLALATLAARLHLVADRLQVSGVGATRIEAEARGTAEVLDLKATVAGLVAPGVTSAMLGASPLALDAQYRKGGSPEIALRLAGDTASVTARGQIPTSRLALDTSVVLPDLAAFAPSVTGRGELAGHIEGTFDNFAVNATTKANITTGGVYSQIAGTIDASGLPAAPAGHVSVRGAYGRDPLTLDAAAAMGPDHLTHVTLTDATFRGVSAKGAFTLATDGGLPTGSLALESRQLPAPASSGVARATIELTRQAAVPLLRVMAEVTSLTVQGTRLARSVLNGTVSDPVGAAPVLNANLVIDGVHTGGLDQNLRVDVSGPQTALAIRVAATGTAAVSAAAVLDVPASRLVVQSLQGTARGQTLRLSGPTALTYAPQVVLGATRITLGGSRLDLQGRLAPDLDLTAGLIAVPAELVRLFDPKLAAEGTLQATGRIQGTAARPTGSVRLSGSGLRLRDPRGIPPVRIDAQAELAGGRARVDATLAAGASQARISGVVPVAAGGAWDLTARGTADLSVLDPFLTGAGAQARGQLGFDAVIAGAEPRPAGTLTLHRGSFAVPAQGARLSEVEAQIRADAGRLVLESLSAKAGGGSVQGSGSVGLAAPMPIDLRFAARNASPLASDLITAVFDADLTLSGAVQTAMTAAGQIRIGRVEINLPQRLPASLAVLNIRQKGPPPKPAPLPVPINLDISLEAPGQIYVRGRGLDAELGGKLHIGGTAASPRPDGGFQLRRGSYSIAGQSLTFSTGKVGFDGNLPIDPGLDFAATTLTTKMAATLSVTGTATHPRVALSSVPDLPQDEVLAQLLFRRSVADLGAFQLAQIAAALAQVADVGGSGGIDPLDRVRRGLGLDVLSVGGSPGSSGPTLEAGRNLGHGVYLGAKQSTSGSGSQATVRIDLATGLRLEADLGVGASSAGAATPGAPPTGNQVGITYEFEY